MKPYGVIIVATAMLLLVGFLAIQPATAGNPAQSSQDYEACLACHGNPALKHTFPSGEEWSLYVNEEVYQNSIHGERGLVCTACHVEIEGYPHRPLEVTSVRAYQLRQYRACIRCHERVYQDTLDSIHASELSAGNFDAPVCTDCHGAHDVSSPHEPRTKIAEACSSCHNAIYQEYVGSVHGKALTDEDNTDVPTCTDCHGVHHQEDPRTVAFRINSPQLCAECHADEEMMAKYGISTNVFNTYVADFHGTTVTLFERVSPDLPTNAPVCYDCHGVHDMQRADDPESQVFKENLLEACRKCHPDASANFPTSWLGHYEPSLEKYPLVYFVNLFYQILIPLVLGFMLVYVVLDAGSRLLRRRRGTHREEEQA